MNIPNSIDNEQCVEDRKLLIQEVIDRLIDNNLHNDYKEELIKLNKKYIPKINHKRIVLK